MRISGTPIVPGVAQGSLWTPPPPKATAPSRDLTFEDFERARVRFVRNAAALPTEFATMYRALAEDPMWEQGIEGRLADGEPLVEAVDGTAREASHTLGKIDDPYLRGRAADIAQIAAQFVRLLGEPVEAPAGSIACLADVTAVELQNWSERLAGVVLVDVAPTSHLAIVARGLGLPTIALFGEDGARAVASATGAPSGAPSLPNRAAGVAMLNGFAGWLETSSDADLRRQFPAERVTAKPDPQPVTVRGRRVGIFANLNRSEEAHAAAAIGADGVGLVRTEFLYAGRTQPPSLDVERRAYQTIAEAFAGKPIIVRTFDLGGDKTGPGAPADGTDRGMLGARGIRLSLEQPALFAQHLRAIIDGFGGADLRIMFPMISVPAEFAQVRDIVRAVVEEITSRKMPPLGLMLEVPAAAFALGEFARQGARFISLGTNDLEQYFFATNRLTALQSPARGSGRPAWERFLRDVITKAKNAGLEIGVCGEAAGDPDFTEFWVQNGIDELSTAPGLVPWLKHHVRTLGAR